MALPVFVISNTGNKLMPTTRYRRVRLLLKDGQAKIYSRHPFTIQLQYDCPEIIQDLEIGVDSGYVHFATSVKSEHREFASAQFDMLDNEKERHDAQRKYRRTRRNRLRYREPRFNNRTSTKPKGWIAPSLQHKVDAQVDVISRICNVAPVTSVTVEVGVFDPALMSAMQTTGKPLQGEDYQHGPLYYADNLRNAVFQRDNYTCRICNKSSIKDDNVILVMHHALYWQGRHADTLNECMTLCTNCHTSENHEEGGKLWGLTPKVPRLEGPTFMNTVRWKIINTLKEKLPNVEIRSSYGSETARTRKDLGLEKSHTNDAYCIGKYHPQKRAVPAHYKKKRRNNRILTKFYDAKIYDIRDGKLKSGKKLGCNRTNRKEPRNSAKNCRIFRGEYKRKGYITLREEKCYIKVGDVVIYKKKKYNVLGTSTQIKVGENNEVKISTSIRLLDKKDSPTGHELKPSINKISFQYHANGWIKIN